MSLSFPSCHPSEILISFSLSMRIYYVCIGEYDDDNNDQRYYCCCWFIEENLCLHVYPVEANRIFMTSGK